MGNIVFGHLAGCLTAALRGMADQVGAKDVAAAVGRRLDQEGASHQVKERYHHKWNLEDLLRV
jgi:hypothetical protein